MDNPIIFYDDINVNKRFSVKHKEGGIFCVDDKDDKFPEFIMESGTARKVVNYLNEEEKIKEGLLEEIKDLSEENMKFKEIRNNKYNNHYLISAISKGYDDSKLAKLILEKLPKNFNVFSDNKFLIVEYKIYNNDDFFNGDIIADLLKISKNTLSFETNRYINDVISYKIFYFEWEKILEKENILGD